MPRVVYSADKKARTVARLLAGETIEHAAQQETLSTSTVSAWRAAAAARLGFDAKREAELDGLLLAYLRTGLTTLVLQAEQFADPVWYKQASPADVAVLHGVLADKLLRILEGQPRPDDR